MAAADSFFGHISRTASLLTNHTSDKCGLRADVLCLLFLNYPMLQKMLKKVCLPFLQDLKKLLSLFQRREAEEGPVCINWLINALISASPLAYKLL